MGMILQSMVMMRDKSGICIAKKYICLHMSETASRWQKVNNHILMKREKENNHGFIQYINIDRRPCIIFVWYECNGDGLAKVSGGKLEKILENLTSNPIKAVLLGAGVTAVIQSSSATTVMVVGFVNSGIMKLSQAVGVIMGANIGTTITGQLIALDVGALAPLIAFVGVAILVFVKNKKIQHIAGIVAGIGVLFIGMDMMKEAMVPLQESQVFIDAMTTISNPILAILLGAGFTALIQSSSASVGILQALALSGLIPLSSAIYIIFGQNIGTCITAVLAS